MGPWFPFFSVHTVNHCVIVLFSCKAYVLLFKLIKEKKRTVGQLWTKAYLLKWTHTILSTSLLSTSSTGWSTAGIADSKLNQILYF
jgi:hypothetical protein